ncbi:DUF3825 domain-containing protein [Streptococcus hyointestinalis]|uniref:DUF3825 domain-containing protein n=1 Tax=Streptococcus hyointestinalis TaxID=1337 RepID=UPI0013E01384|nr:DUF3825 domain-containing protein [Streptococcus hyointestinalis]
MNLEKYLIKKDTDEIIWKFAFLGTDNIRNQRFQELADLAEPENWTSANSNRDNNILYSYITNTFSKAFELGDSYILVTPNEDFACFNTGLLTENGEDIICLFNTYDSSPDYHWHLSGFKKVSDWDFMSHFSKTPKVVNFFSNPADIYFDPTKELIKNLDHILNDNFDRFSSKLQEKGKPYINALLNQALDLTITKCKRNYRIAVPQYYKGKITYLLPVTLDGQLMSLAIEEINGRYRVNTIFTVEMAYKNARLLMKPEVDWLTSATKNKKE